LAPVVVGTVVVVAALATWALLVRPGDDSTRSAPAAAPSAAASQGPRTDPIPVDPSAVSEPMLVVEGYVDSLNRGDSAGALAAFSDAAALISPRCQPACVGTAAIGPSLAETTTTHDQLTLTDPRVEGDTVTAHFSVASPEFPSGVQRVIGTTFAVIRNQKIALLSMNWDATDPQTATVLNAQDESVALTPQGPSLEQARQELTELFPSGH
jgi:hypothetical protein